jgi:catechol 2,3-dioxygenase-like lactoylglutathione lyase family enzyme
MAVEIDHLILAVNDRARSLDFYTSILGFTHEGEDGPFSTLRVNASFVIQVSASGTNGGEHLAFSMSKAEFDEIFNRLQSAKIPYGDHFNTVGSMQGPGDEIGARGVGKTIYFFDPDRHLIEIRHYER